MFEFVFYDGFVLDDRNSPFIDSVSWSQSLRMGLALLRMGADGRV